MPVGIKSKKPINPFLSGGPQSGGVDSSAFAIVEAIAYSDSAVDYGNSASSSSSVVAEAIQTSDSSKATSSQSDVVGEAVAAPVWSNQKESESSVVGEAIFDDGSVSTGLDIYSNSVLVQSKAQHLDIIGPDASAGADGAGAKIFHPSPTYVSHFNTNDGTTTGVVPDTTTSSRNVSVPTIEGTPFYSGAWTGLHPCTRTSPTLWSTPQDVSFADNSTTTFSVTVTDPTGTIATHTTPGIVTDVISTGSNITVTVAGWVADGDKWRADVTIAVDIDTLLSGNSGRFGVVITHTDGADGVFTKTQVDLFYDTETQVFVLTGPTSALNTPTTKQISGIYYMTTGTTFDFAIADMDYSNADSFPTNLVALTLAPFGIPNTNLTSADLTGWTNAFDNIDDTWASTLAISVASYRLCGANAVFSANPQDWVALGAVSAAGIASLIDTYADNATNGSISIIEEFNGEAQRVDAAGVAFVSTATLAADELLLHCGSIMVQQTDWTAYLPHNGTTIINPDYTASGGAVQRYYRFYTTDGTTRSGGVFTFGGVLEADLTAGTIEIEVSLDGIAWYTTSSNYLGGALGNGDGCRVSGQTLPNLEITLGTYTSNNASGMVPVDSIMVRVSMLIASAVEPTQMNFVFN